MAFAGLQVINTHAKFPYMAILTLTTDWGLRDHYVGSFKGELLSGIPNLQLIDISNEIEKFNSMQAAFVIKNCYRKFPKGTIHFIGLSSNDNFEGEYPFVIVKSGDQYLIGEDTGIFTLIVDKNDYEVIRLPWPSSITRKQLSDSILDLIKKMVNNSDINKLGKKEDTLKESYFAIPTIDSSIIRGTIIYIDFFGNAIVNITQELFEKERKGRAFTIYFSKTSYNVNSICSSYEDVEVGEMLAHFNQDGFLEIALNKSSASQLLGLKLMEPIRIEFHDNANS